jgi:hypothetical protein
MNKFHKNLLVNLSSQLDTLDESINTPVARYQLETRARADDLLEISANPEGMIFLARCCLKMALGSFAGKQWQIDEHNMLDHCDMKMALTLIGKPIAERTD